MTPRGIKWQIAVVTTLVVVPVLFLVSVGLYHLWDRGWSFIAYWPMAACLLGAYVLSWYWTRRLRKAPLPTATAPLPGYWTDRDKQAWKTVEDRIAALKPQSPKEMTELNLYATMAQELALPIARVYNPKSHDPFSHLTLPEILACGELVTEDLNRLVEEFVPGSHILSIGDMMRIRTVVDQATDWYPRIRNLYWVVSAVMNPITTGMQVAMTKGAMGPAQKSVQQNILLWFQIVFLRELGRYLIELNSGRLKVGAKRYRELLAEHDPNRHANPESATAPPPSPTKVPPPVTIAIVGPVKAGKSSLVNALLGEQRAATDVLPLTAGHVRYTLQQPNLPTFTLIDTAGFGNEGPSEDDVKVAVDAAKIADVMLVVVPARSAARKPEVDFLDRVRSGLLKFPTLKMPPVIAVISHIDLLSPAMEWAPPYNWPTGTRPKEESIRDATMAAKEQFSTRVFEVIPVCTSVGKELGVRDELLAAVATQLGEARGVSLLRSLHAEASSDQTKRVFSQLMNVGGQALKLLWEMAKK